VDHPYRSRVLEGLGVRPWINARTRSTLIEEDSDKDGNSFAEGFDDGGSDWPLMGRAVLWLEREEITP